VEWAAVGGGVGVKWNGGRAGVGGGGGTRGANKDGQTKALQVTCEI
jgi:hypothetical protein